MSSPAIAGVSSIRPLDKQFDQERLEDMGFLTAMTLVLLGNYAQTGHYGGPLAYTPYNIAVHLAGPEFGGLRYDYRRPKHPYCDKFMLAGGHCIPTCYALWILMGEAMDAVYKANRRQEILRRSPRRDAGHRCARFPPRRRSSQDAARRQRSGRQPAVR